MEDSLTDGGRAVSVVVADVEAADAAGVARWSGAPALRLDDALAGRATVAVAPAVPTPSSTAGPPAPGRLRDDD